MRQIILVVVLAVVLAATATKSRSQEALRAVPAAKPAPSVSATSQADESAIRRAAEDFAKSYNTKDAKAVAALFMPNAEIMDDGGRAFQGRENIEKVFDEAFKEQPKAKIKISIKSIRFITPAVAVEDGTTTVDEENGGLLEQDRYTLVHVKQDGKWLMASARDLVDDENAAEAQLGQLQWLIGDWVDESPRAVVKTTYHWTDNHRFIIGEYTVQIGGNPAMTGSQRIGWDPLNKQVRCWAFDSQGGFAEGLWIREGNRWIAKMNGVTSDGKPASATNITTKKSKDHMTWQSRDRLIGGQIMPDIEEVSIVRSPPKAATSK